MKIATAGEILQVSEPLTMAATSAYEFPLAFAQERLWFLDQLQPGSVSYSVPWSVHMRGEVHIEALERSLNEIVRRHEALRTTFTAVAGEPRQVVAGSLQVPLPLNDLSRSPNSEQEALAIAAAEVRQPLDLERGPLLRARLVRLGPTDHLLLVTLHHIVFDGWSRRIFSREFAALYEAFRCGNPSPLPEPRLQYADYAVWQRGDLKDSKLERLLAYWKRQLGDAPASLDLPTDHPRPAVETFRGDMELFSFPKILSERLQVLARQEGASMFMTLLAAFQALLSRYSGQEDIVVGSPIANRNRAEIEGLIGLFANTLVLRLNLSGDPSFRDLIRRAKEIALDAYAHEDMPFEKLVQELSPERSLSHNPLFQVLFSLQRASRETFELPGLEVKPFEALRGTAKFDIAMFIFESDHGLRGRLEYSTDLFEAATIRRMLGHFQNLLEGAINDPNTRISDLPLLSPAEEHQVLVEWNHTSKRFSSDMCIQQMFEDQAATTPHNIAVVYEDDCLTYADLNRRANQLAHRLRALGIGPESMVGICVERSVQALVGILGILKAGGAYLPLDLEYPKDRIAFMLEDAKVSVLVTQAGVLAGLPPHGATTICLDSDWPAVAVEPVDNPSQQTRWDNAAYVIYTSGSTGKPKGVVVTHFNVVRLFTATDHWFHFGPQDTWTMFHSFAFDFSVWEIWGALLFGGKLIVVPWLTARSPDQFHELLIKHRVTVLNQTPSAFRQLIAADEKSGRSEELALRYIIFGGEALEFKTLLPWIKRHPKEPSLINMYGITETTVHVTYFKVAEDAIGENTPSLIGTPIPDLQVYVLDSRRRPTPVGVAGELYVGGGGVARGYLNRPELTAERFIRNPFCCDTQARLYKTGDLARFRADGNLQYLGRIDQQVKIRGFRIELGEIESVLSKHPAVKECVVIARQDSSGERRLVAYVVMDGEATAPARELRQLLQAHLPEYMVPSAFVSLAALPLTTNGKVNRQALPAPEYVPGSGTYVAPRTPTENLIASIWVEVLKIERVGVEDDFFELGGHSLLATQVISRVRSAVDVDVPLRSIFEAPTLEAFAARIARTAPSRQMKPIPSVPRNRPLPLSFAQERLWFVDQLEPDSPRYNVPLPMRLKGPLNISAIRSAANGIIRRHEVLRTTFRLQEDRPVQVIAAELTIEVPVIDITHVPVEDRETEARRLAIKEAQRPFDLKVGPLVRAVLLRLDAQEHILVLNIHHIATDGWSIWPFIHELGVLYEACLAGKPSPFAELPIQYADYAVWQRELIESDLLAKQFAYWKKQLAGAPERSELPIDGPRPAVRSHRGSTETVFYSKQVLRGLHLLGQREGATLYMTLLAAYQTLLHRYTGQEKIAVGSPVANRTRAEIEDLIGFFVNTLVMHSDLSGNPTFRELVQRVREIAVGAFTNQDFPFEKLVEAIAPDRHLSSNPLVQVAFVLQNARRSVLQLAGVEFEGMRIHNGTSKFDIGIFIAETPDGLRCMVEYSTDLFEAATIRRMLGHFGVLLKAAVENPGLRLAELPLLTEEESHTLLVEWNLTASEYPRDASIQQLFDAQAAARPDAVALEYGGARMTYGELQRRANQLARHLQRRGVGSGVLVGVCVERSFEMVVALLGILKAGGAYVPLDPGYPVERLSTMLEDTQAPFVLAQERLLERLPPAHQATMICVDRDRQVIEQEAVQQLSSGQAEDLAYVSYTSGSTGRPKGVTVPHRAVVRLVWKPNYVTFSRDDVLLQLAPIGFDASTFEIWGALLNGSRLVIAPPHTPSLEELAGIIRGQGVTILWLTAELFHLMIDEHLESLRGVRQLLAGGDVLSVAHVRRAVQELKGCRVINGYGPTENTTFTCCHHITAESIGSSVPLGQPISNTRIYVLDEWRRVTPIGVAGELYVGGDGLALGYLNDPQLTAERFVEVEGLGRLYRAGDRCRWRGDGLIEFLGRTDHQVKLRGYRIELGEIETTLDQHPAVNRSVVLLREDEPGNKRLVAYVVPQRGAQLQAEDVRAHAKHSLPDFMLPAAVLILNAFPLTPNGKVDRGALPKPEMAPAGSSRPSLPRDAFERVLLGIWKRVLGVRSCGITDNFFELGGHSLLLIRLATMIEKEFKKVVPLAFLFEFPTVEKIAEFLREGSNIKSGFFVPFNEKGSGPAFFCIHNLIGEVMVYRTLAKFLDPDQRFVGIQLPPELRTPEFVSSIEAIASLYVDNLLSFEPEGPYILGGWSAGVSVALEMAQQLQAKGRVVDLLIAIDAAPANTVRRSSHRSLRYWWKVMRNFPYWLVDDLAFDFSWSRFFVRVGRRLSAPARKAAAVLGGEKQMAKYKVWAVLGHWDYSASAKRFMEAFYQALRRYVPQPYSGRVVLYKARTQPLFYLTEPDRAWRRLAKDLEIVPVDGNHVSLIDESRVRRLAEHLSGCLRECRNRALSGASTDVSTGETTSGDEQVPPSPESHVRGVAASCTSLVV